MPISIQYIQTMKKLILALTVVSITFTIQACMTEKNNHTPRILVFSKTAGWQHDSIESGCEALVSLGTANGVIVETSEDAGLFTDESLDRFDAVVFLNTSGTIFDDGQRAAFERYIRNGGGFVGIHGATDTEYDWPWYNKLVGAYFNSHPGNPNVREAVLEVTDADHPATAHLPERWKWADEWYNFRDMNENIRVILVLDTGSYEGSEHPDYHPVAWYHEYDGGRAFYTALGHTIESFSEDLFLQHIWGGVEYAMGKRIMTE
jgi:type 1 glutamine amidotransferase